MQRFILSKKNHITLISGILITIGFISDLGFQNEDIAMWSLAIATILGGAPIAIQAYQALRVKVVSIDVLVTIAVIGAFLIKNLEESAIVTFFLLFGAYLEQRTLNKTRSAIKELTEMAPESAMKQMGNGEFEEVGEDTTFGKIIELVEEAQDSKSEAERFIDGFSKYYTPAVLVLSVIVWIFSRDIDLAITILVLGCPGALVIGVPVSNVAGIGNGARNGILLKGSEVIQDFSKIDTIVFDKTGTLTIGNPKVVDKEFYTENVDELLSYLASVENESTIH